MSERVSRLIELSKRLVWLATKGLIIDLVLLDGELTNDGPNIRCLLVGSSLFLDDFKHRVYNMSIVEVRKWRMPIFLLPLYIRNHANKFDICVSSLPSIYGLFLDRFASFKGNEFVEQIIETSGGWDGLRKNISGTKRNLINSFERKYNLEMKISTDLADLPFFYNRMFIPYIRTRFGPLALYDSYEEIKRFFDEGMLMFISKDGRPLAAALCRLRGGNLLYTRAGVLDGDEKLVNCGVLTAVYYYQIKYAIENALKSLDVQGSRPYLNDGVYYHKATWGACSRPDTKRSAVAVHYICTGPPTVIAHLFEACPTIVQAGGGLRAIIGYTKNPEPSSAELAAAIKGYYLAGVKEVVFMTRTGQKILPI